MYSRLDSIFKTGFREAETLDTRQAIRRHEPENKRKKHNQNSEDSEFDEEKEKPQLSVISVINFLETLLNDNPQSQTDNQKGARPRENRPERPSSHKAQSQQSQKAINAYKRTYNATHEDKILPETNQGTKAETGINLSQAEIELIHPLIKDLKKLQQNHVEYITLQGEGNILQNLLNAVKSGLSTL